MSVNEIFRWTGTRNIAKIMRSEIFFYLSQFQLPQQSGKTTPILQATMFFFLPCLCGHSTAHIPCNFFLRLHTKFAKSKIRLGDMVERIENTDNIIEIFIAAGRSLVQINMDPQSPYPIRNAAYMKKKTTLTLTLVVWRKSNYCPTAFGFFMSKRYRTHRAFQWWKSRKCHLSRNRIICNSFCHCRSGWCLCVCLLVCVCMRTLYTKCGNDCFKFYSIETSTFHIFILLNGGNS